MFGTINIRFKRVIVERAFIAALLFLVSTMPATVVGAQELESATPDARAMAEQFSSLFESASKKVSPSVVPIFAEQEVTNASAQMGPNDDLRRFFGDDFFRRFFGEQNGQGRRTVHSMGSGVIVSEDGYILTNNHVVSGADKLTVVMEDGKKYSAKVIGTDPPTDVAVIKIDAKGLKAATLGNSDDVKIGEWVIAVGNPFQLLHSVTAGIISAKGRSSIGLADYEDFIQTDASINPGNSGGALADLDGNVVGINTAISSPSGANAGIGFAIPIKMAQSVMNQLISGGTVSRGFLALVPQDIDDNLADAMHLKSKKGALVGDVTSGGPADKAGIKSGDVIVSFDGQDVNNSTELRNEVAAVEPGKKVPVKLVRDGKGRTVHVILGERPTTAQATTREGGGGGEEDVSQFGLDVQDLTPDIARQLNLQGAQGVLVAAVEPGSAASDARLARGDLIEEVNHQAVNSVGELQQALSGLHKGDNVLLQVRRGQYRFFAALNVPS